MAVFWYQTVNADLPHAAYSKKVEINLQRLNEHILTQKEPEIERAFDTLLRDPSALRIFNSLFGNSPFLTECLLKNLAFTLEIFKFGPDHCFQLLIETLEKTNIQELDEKQLASLLRKTKQKAALSIALADICQTWHVMQVTHALTRLAEICLQSCVSYILYEGHRRQYFKIKDQKNPEIGSGYIILGMGKLGGYELNYSSDIDVIILYDTDLIETDKPFDLQSNIVRLTKILVRLMEERTPDGYVFRTDLRLRPDPGSTPLALSVLAAETYYESIGQNWERAAMIKARPVAGDIKAGENFLAILKPFMWRKYMDFAAIQDIHSIKRQINAHKGGRRIQMKGHNVKLGHGGIREIEFFAQTQQLIWGGRVPELRIAPTCKALQALVDIKQISQQKCNELIESYEFLRTLEHRIQMINDEQTHSIPKDEQAILHLSIFLGYETVDEFEKKLLFHLKRVESYYADLFSDKDDQQSEMAEGNLVFAGSEIDPNTIEYLASLGFNEPTVVDQTVKGWHHSRYRATRSTRAREILTDIIPTLLAAFAQQAQPDLAFRNFDTFLSRLPAGVQLFSMFKQNPHLLDLVAEIMGEAPRLAHHLAKNPNILEYVLTPSFFNLLPERDVLQNDLHAVLKQARDFQDILDLARRWANDRKFQIGVQTLRHITSTQEAARALSDIADCIINEFMSHVHDELARQHGRFEEGRFAIIALGKLGSREMTPTSDLDLIFIYHVPDGVTMSNGERPLSPARYYARFAQRFINALNAPTSEGILYEVDMRLRPSGNAGPIATSLDAFKKYHAEAAWTWEHMALSRARISYAKPDFSEKLLPVIHHVLTMKREPRKLVFDVSDMRQKIERQYKTQNIWNLKYYRGGILDIDFIAQYLLLKHAHDYPEMVKNSTTEIILKAHYLKLISDQCANDLLSAFNLWGTLQAFLRLTIAADSFKESNLELPESLEKDIVSITGKASFDILIKDMKNAFQAVMLHYNEIIESPAATINKDL